MKKVYAVPAAERVQFAYSDQVHASGGVAGDCGWHWENFESAITSGCSQDFYGSAAGT